MSDSDKAIQERISAIVDEVFERNIDKVKASIAEQAMKKLAESDRGDFDYSAVRPMGDK